MMNKLRASIAVRVFFITGLVWMLSALPATAQTLQLSRNADFSTNDGIFFFSGTLHAKVTAPQINPWALEKNEFRLQSANGGQELDGSFDYSSNGIYTAHIPLSGLNHSEHSWEFRAEIRDHDNGRFEARVNIVIQESGAWGDSLAVTARIDSVGDNFLFLSGEKIFVDNNTLITENGVPLAFSALKKNWKVFVFALLRNDNTFAAVVINVLERSTTDREVETEGLIASIDSAVVTVNNIHFFVTNNTEIVDKHGQTVPFAQLKVGMKVHVKGQSKWNGEVHAVRIEILEDDVHDGEFELTGTIDHIIADSSQKFIVVKNTLFEVTGETEILGFENEPISLNDLHVGELVQVKARTRSGKVPLALRIKREDRNGEDLEITGLISAIGDSTFRIERLVFRVVHSTIILDHDNNFVSFSALRTGQLVEVRANLLPDSTYIATRVKIETEVSEFIEVRGFIEALGDHSVTVSGQEFWVDDSTRILDENENVTDFAALRVGMLVEVKGWRRVDGSLRALQIKIEDFLDDEIEIRGMITAIGGDSLQVSGITFFVNASTEIIGSNGQLIDFSELSVGMIVQVRADRENGRWIASRIHVEDRIDAVVEFFGRIDSLRADSFFVLAQRIIVANTTIFLDENGGVITFADLHVGDFVQVKAMLLPDSAFVALRVKREDNQGDEIEFTGSISLLSFSSIVVSGLTFEVNGGTEYIDHNGHAITIEDLHLGMVVQVKAAVGNDGSFLAVRVKVEQRHWLAGVVSSVDGNTVVVQGLAHTLTEASVIFDSQNYLTTPQALRANQQVQIVAEANVSQLEVVTLRIVFDGGATTGVDDQPATPQSFALMQNYPNPFNPTTQIRFVLPSSGKARLTIYDILGRRIRTLVDGARPAGEQQVTWDGRDEAGASVASGIYFYRLEASGLTQARKLTLLR